MPDTPLPPGSTIGILGGGQLGRMLAVAASRLGLKSHVYSDEAGAPALIVFDAGNFAGRFERVGVGPRDFLIAGGLT